MTKSQIKLCEKIYNNNKSSYSRLTMMAFLFKGKSLISQGINSDKTDPIQNKFRKQIINNDNYIDKRHAEVDCLKSFIEDKEIDFKSLTLFVLSKKANGEYRNSKPCPICRKMIESLGVGEICYIYNGRLINEKLLNV
jgi:deoxycytidylate deaminase